MRPNITISIPVPYMPLDTHPDTGQPTNAAAIAQTGSQADKLKTKYRPVIG